MRFLFRLTFLLLFLWIGCKKDRPLPFQPPETALFVDSIGLVGENRLPTTVRLYWQGMDGDGYVVGFEYSLDGVTWHWTTRWDSTFRFSLSPNQDTLDVHFWIRAVDDQGLRDPTPAYLRIPIKNSPPTATFVEDTRLPDTVPVLITLLVTASDPDGNETLDSLFLRVNGGNWVPLPRSTNLITIVPTDPSDLASTTAYVYVNTKNQPESQVLTDFHLGDTNRFFIRARDNGGLLSTPDTSRAFVILPKTGNWLVIDHWKLQNPVRPYTIYSSLFQSIGLAHTYLDFTRYVFPYKNPTLKRYFEQFDVVFWYAQNGAYELDQIAQAEPYLVEHLNRGGKVWVVYPLASNEDTTSVLFRLFPIDSLSTVWKNGLIATTDSLVSLESGYPHLQNGTGIFILGVNPFYPMPTSVPLYEAKLVPPWNGSRVVMAAFINNGRKNLIYSAVSPHQFTGNGKLDSLFLKVKDDFNW